MKTGWIKISRKIKNWQHYQNGPVFRVFMDLLLDAYSYERVEKGKTVGSGQVLVNINKIKASTGIKSSHTIIDALAALVESGEITRERIGNDTIVTINQFLNYQGSAKNALPKEEGNAKNALPKCKKCTTSSAKNALPLIGINNSLNIKENNKRLSEICAREEKIEPQKPQKMGFEKYGQDGLVELKPVEHRTLVETFGEEKVRAAIEDLNDKIAAGGDDSLNNAKSHFHVLRYWLRYRKDSDSTKPQQRKIDLNALKHN